jgi:hypothetical protein
MAGKSVTESFDGFLEKVLLNMSSSNDNIDVIRENLIRGVTTTSHALGMDRFIPSIQLVSQAVMAVVDFSLFTQSNGDITAASNLMHTTTVFSLSKRACEILAPLIDLDLLSKAENSIAAYKLNQDHLTGLDVYRHLVESKKPVDTIKRIMASREKLIAFSEVMKIAVKLLSKYGIQWPEVASKINYEHYAVTNSNMLIPVVAHIALVNKQEAPDGKNVIDKWLEFSKTKVTGIASLATNNIRPVLDKLEGEHIDGLAEHIVLLSGIRDKSEHEILAMMAHPESADELDTAIYGCPLPLYSWAPSLGVTSYQNGTIGLTLLAVGLGALNPPVVLPEKSVTNSIIGQLSKRKFSTIKIDKWLSTNYKMHESLRESVDSWLKVTFYPCVEEIKDIVQERDATLNVIEKHEVIGRAYMLLEAIIDGW